MRNKESQYETMLELQMISWYVGKTDEPPRKFGNSDISC